MQIRRLVTLAVVVAFLGSASSVFAQKQPKRTDAERRDIQTLVRLVDDVAEGKTQAPTDVAITWDSNHFVKGAGGATYIPFTVAVDTAQIPSKDAALYVRVVEKPSAQPAEGKERKDDDDKKYPWDNVHFLQFDDAGKATRAMAVPPGEYDVFIAVKEKGPEKQQRNAPPAKLGLLRRDLTVPSFEMAELTTSSVIIANAIEPLSAPLSPEEQQENPYTFGTMKVVPDEDLKVSKAGELRVLFWIYGTGVSAGKPDVTVEYNFHHKTAEGEKFFNKTAPQALNAQTLPPQFDVAAGHQLPGSLVVPLASFPEGEYRLEIKVTDKLAGKTLTQNAAFTVGS